MNKNEPTNYSCNAGSITSLTRRATPGIRRVLCHACAIVDGASRALSWMVRPVQRRVFGESCATRATPCMCVPCAAVDGASRATPRCM